MEKIYEEMTPIDSRVQVRIGIIGVWEAKAVGFSLSRFSIRKKLIMIRRTVWLQRNMT